MPSPGYSAFQAPVGPTAPKHLDVLWEGAAFPTRVGVGVMWRIPQIQSVDATFTLSKLSVQVIGTQGVAVTFKVQKSTDSGANWTDVQALTLPANTLVATTAVVGSVTSGNLLRLYWTAVGNSGVYLYTIQLEGDQP